MSEGKLGVAMYMWKKSMEIIYDAKNNDQSNIRWAYVVTIRKYTESLCAKVEAEDRHKYITLSGDVIELLNLIKNKSYSY